MTTSRITILGIPVDCCSRLEFRAFLQRAVRRERMTRIVTLNPEIAVAAVREPRYRASICAADVITMDGVGIAIAARLQGVGSPGRITGTDVMTELCDLSVEQSIGTTFLLRADGLTSPELLRTALAERWPALAPAIAMVDPWAPLDAALIHAMNDHAPRILVVGFGHPIQEAWIAQHVNALTTVRVAVGVGGALDYLSGAATVPPPIVRRLGGEWLWRLWRKPRRLPRTIRAVIVFPMLVFLESLRLLLPARLSRSPS